ncbi:hypothetical protein VNO77_14536 [Canavalia gladiata]|uniref:FAR1 domain-containing protein n=1 Tax=Canavalia gladiata TaxID=3824 RepID=A0AAN9LYX6_CANGL
MFISHSKTCSCYDLSRCCYNFSFHINFMIATIYLDILSVNFLTPSTLRNLMCTVLDILSVNFLTLSLWLDMIETSQGFLPLKALDEELAKVIGLTEQSMEPTNELCMHGETLQELPEHAYKRYASSKGFASVIRNSKKGKDDEVRYMLLCCFRERLASSGVPNNVKTYSTSKIHCPSGISVSLQKDRPWVIQTIFHNHLHEVSLGKSRLFATNRIILMHVQRTADINDDVDVQLNKTFHSLVYTKGGYE